MRARMTILAIEAELNRKTTPQSLTTKWAFDPDEEVTFDASVLLAAIINRGASFCVLYPDPDYFKLMSDSWWDKWEASFLAWFKSMQMEYNPIENYDRIEEWHEDIIKLEEYYVNPVRNNFFIACLEESGEIIGTIGIRAYDKNFSEFRQGGKDEKIKMKKYCI